MRSARKPLTPRRENADELLTSPRSTANNIQESLTSLCDIIQKFQGIDTEIFELVANINSLSRDISSRKQTKSTVSDLQTQFHTITANINGIVDKINSADLVELTTREFDRLSSILAKVNANPPSTPTLGKEHRSTYKCISNTVISAKASFAEENMNSMSSQLLTLKHDLSHEYEPFFRLSQIDKAWRLTIIDECRQIIDKIVDFSNMWNDIGTVRLQPLIDDINRLFETWKKESATSLKRRSPSASLIPRPSSLRTLASSEKKLLDRTDKEPHTPRRSGRIPVSTRSKSATRYSHKKTSFDIETDFSMTTREPRTPGSETKVRQSGITPPRARRSVVDLGKTVPIKVVPLLKSPRINHTLVEDDMSSSDDEFMRANQEMTYQSPTLNRLATDLAEIQAESSSPASEWHEIEAKFAKHIAALGTNPLFGKLLSQIRAMGKRSRVDYADLKELMQEIEQKVLTSKPIFEVEQRLDDVSHAIARFCSEGSEEINMDTLTDMQKRLEAVKEQCEKAAWETQLKELRVELLRVHEVATKFASHNNTELELDNISAENIKLRQQLDETAQQQDNGFAEKREKVCAEMKAVQGRIAALQIERRHGKLPPDEAQDLEAEFDALLEQQMGLVNSLAALK